MQNYDDIIIGTGQAGPALAHRLADAGRTVAVIERKFFGGTCVNTGCTPTKTLVASAYAAHMARRAADFGVKIPCEISVDMKAVKARKDLVSGVSREGVEQSLRNLTGCTVYQGHARFVGTHLVEVGSEILEAESIFINVGGRALTPPIPGLDEVGYFTNSSIMDVDFLPPHLIILGGSYIGLEFAQVYRRFGSEVSVVELAPHLIAREDTDVSLAVTDILRKEGINIYVNSRVTGVARHGNDIAVEIARDGIGSQIVGSHLLMAIGRRPNTDDLGLEIAGEVVQGVDAWQPGDRVMAVVTGGAYAEYITVPAGVVISSENLAEYFARNNPYVESLENLPCVCLKRAWHFCPCLEES